MGVNDLWSIVEPVRESVPLYSLSGKTLAVDLSLWVCEAQHVQAMMGRVTKPHLRNLFFRVSCLTLMGVKLVFVMEGEPPKLKAETIKKRKETKYGGFKKSAAPKCTTIAGRGRFNAVLRECAEMLDYMGLPWVTAAGEAEAMCAYLDSQGLVDGCITNDGDAFLYGARTVYRNFNMNTKDPQVDCYRTCRVQTELHLSRESLVGLAILLGCDYIPKGIPGVGKEQALRLIHRLQGQTLLQRFSQWKEDAAFVSEGAAKKVPHCNVCRHPGSAKVHERGGCLLCDSKHFCQPQDFDYQCPCDWHGYEQSRQALSFEANIRKKTLASPMFPFTEIIKEFLVFKDKPVSHFKRRQPNLLLMQKFASDKMEWPAHYTSEKVLVLMTYTNLMNRKHGREVSLQIKPLRILKPRVRNGVSCLEVVWRTPEHYAFPEDQDAETRLEVRTVEEECLFRVAYPEVVERYWREKALVEENKTKNKKTKSKKEKAADVSDGLSDLLGNMTIQGPSSAKPETQSQIHPLVTSKTTEPEVVLLDTPISHKGHQKELRGDARLTDCPSTPASGAESDAAASLSVSAVLDALHLSQVDWDSSSFTSSPPQVTTNPPPSQAPDDEAKENIKRTTSNGVKPPDSSSASERRYSECSLRERVMMRNTAEAMNRMNVDSGAVSKQLSYDVTEDISSEPHGQIFTEGRNAERQLLGTKHSVERKESVGGADLCVKNNAKPQTCSSKQQLKPTVPAPDTISHTCTGPKKPPQKYTFVKGGVSSCAANPLRHRSDPGQSDTNTHITLTAKKSVCSSSDDSDVENRQSGPRRKTKAKSRYVAGVSLKPVSRLKSVQTQKTDVAHLLVPRSQSCSVDVGTKYIPVSVESQSPDIPSAAVDDVFTQTPASPITIEDSDDSVICSDSPLPLAERLRLKFMM